MTQELFPSLPTSKPAKVRKKRKLTTSQQIIIRHVSDMKGNYNPLDWGREGRLCATLSKKYGSDFLLWVSPPEGYKVSSLTFYYSVMGRNHLSDQLVEYSKLKKVSDNTKIKEIEMSETKIGEDIIPSNKPKTLKEFLEYGKKIGTAGEHRL